MKICINHPTAQGGESLVKNDLCLVCLLSYFYVLPLFNSYLLIKKLEYYINVS